LKSFAKFDSRHTASIKRRLPPVVAIPKTNVQTKASRRLTVDEFANGSSLYLALLALLGRWFPGPNFQANRLSVLAAICEKMQRSERLR